MESICDAELDAVIASDASMHLSKASNGETKGGNCVAFMASLVNRRVFLVDFELALETVNPLPPPAVAADALWFEVDVKWDVVVVVATVASPVVVVALVESMVGVSLRGVSSVLSSLGRRLSVKLLTFFFRLRNILHWRDTQAPLRDGEVARVGFRASYSIRDQSKVAVILSTISATDSLASKCPSSNLTISSTLKCDEIYA